MTTAAPRSAQSLEASFLAFVAVDIGNFLLFLTALAIEGLGRRDLFRTSSALLDRNLGVLNTSILITSGWMVAIAVAATRAGRPRSAALALTAATAVGSGFGIVKVIEYAAKLRHGVTPQTNEFFAFYYVITGIHFIHWAIGLAFLAALSVLAWMRYDTEKFRKWITIGGLYWHMVDVIWIIIFPCLYFQWAA